MLDVKLPQASSSPMAATVLNKTHFAVIIDYKTVHLFELETNSWVKKSKDRTPAEGTGKGAQHVCRICFTLHLNSLPWIVATQLGILVQALFITCSKK